MYKIWDQILPIVQYTIYLRHEKETFMGRLSVRPIKRLVKHRFLLCPMKTKDQSIKVVTIVFVLFL